MPRSWILLVVLVTVASCGDGARSEPGTVASGSTSPMTTAVATTGAVSTSAVTTASTVPDDEVALISVVEAAVLSLTVDDKPADVGSRVAVDRGATVRLAMLLEHADEVHVHGYDLSIDVVPGVEATLEFVADIPGIFEVELEGSRHLLFELEVS